jgi:hypothetical protein
MPRFGFKNGIQDPEWGELLKKMNLSGLPRP